MRNRRESGEGDNNVNPITLLEYDLGRLKSTPENFEGVVQYITSGVVAVGFGLNVEGFLERHCIELLAGKK